MYSLVNHSFGVPPSAAGLASQLSEFETLFEYWCHPSGGRPSYLAYALSHKYTGERLAVANLKGRDNAQVRCVSDACHDNGNFSALLASMTMSETYPNDERCQIDSEGKPIAKVRQLYLSRVVDENGFELQTSLPISGDFLMQGQLYDGREPDRRTGGQYLRYQHAEITQYYDDTVSDPIVIESAFSSPFARSY